MLTNFYRSDNKTFAVLFLLNICRDVNKFLPCCQHIFFALILKLNVSYSKLEETIKLMLVEFCFCFVYS